ncbi:unnamed protein product [marine sediment metagenome]|uniref:Uncharacterized protein n=1 Tax=marine sediment metagenome TaxID=412755 RepID=X1A5J7_9ZZZZ
MCACEWNKENYGAFLVRFRGYSDLNDCGGKCVYKCVYVCVYVCVCVCVHVFMNMRMYVSNYD